MDPAESGNGHEWADQELMWTLRGLRKHEGLGGDLVVVGLHSPAAQNRKMALDVLKAWTAAAWPEDARPLAEELAATDPNQYARQRARETLEATSS